MTTIVISWQDINSPESASAYRVYMSSSPIDIDNPPTPIAQVENNVFSHTVENLTHGATYYFRISSILEDLEEFSEQLEVKAKNNIYTGYGTYYKYGFDHKGNGPSLEYVTSGSLRGIDVDRYGNLYTLTSTQIAKHDSSGNELWSKTSSGSPRNSSAVAVSISGDVYYLHGNDSVVKRGPNGDYIHKFDTGRDVSCLAIDPQNVIWVAYVSGTYFYLYRLDSDLNQINRARIGSPFSQSLDTDSLQIRADTHGNIYALVYLSNEARLYKVDAFLNTLYYIDFSIAVYDFVVDEEGQRIIFASAEGSKVYDMEQNEITADLPQLPQAYKVEMDENRNLYFGYRDKVKIFDHALNEIGNLTTDHIWTSSCFAVDPGRLVVSLGLLEKNNE